MTRASQTISTRPHSLATTHVVLGDGKPELHILQQCLTILVLLDHLSFFFFHFFFLVSFEKKKDIFSPFVNCLPLRIVTLTARHQASRWGVICKGDGRLIYISKGAQSQKLVGHGDPIERPYTAWAASSCQISFRGEAQRHTSARPRERACISQPSQAKPSPQPLAST